MKTQIKTVKGTREFYPEEMALRNYLYGKMREISHSYGYQEWDGPFLETIDLYAAKSGEELVKEQSFVFEDRGGDLVTLRPELTPSLARMIASRQGQLTFPLRWWSFGPFWRYERPQKGRTREFFQWNIDMLGVASPEADAELVAIAAGFLRSVGLRPDQAKLYVNDRRLVEAQFEKLGVPAGSRLALSGMVDRRLKMDETRWDEAVLGLGLSAGQLSDLKSLLTDRELWRGWDDLVRLFAMLEALGVSEYVEFDPGVTRGLLYYTGTVFEAFDLSGGVRRSILGGGRYDNLLRDVGGEPLSGVGFAMGDVVIGILLQESGLLPQFDPTPAAALVTIFDEDSWRDAYALAAELRAAGLEIACYPEPAKLPKQLKYADRLAIPVALIVGPEEKAKGMVTVKDLRRAEQQTVPRAELTKHIERLLW